MNINTLKKPIDILLVDDSASDAELTEEALSNSKVVNALHWVEDGLEALDFLRQKGKYTNAPRPDLILLDLNLPKKDGREVLAQIKADPSLRLIPVVVFTTSAAEGDILNTYELNANCYVSKPIDLDQFISVIKLIEAFWLAVVKLPSEQ